MVFLLLTQNLKVSRIKGEITHGPMIIQIRYREPHHTQYYSVAFTHMYKVIIEYQPPKYNLCYNIVHICQVNY